jgi:Zn-dependent protease
MMVCMNIIDIVFGVAILVMSVVVHEVAHGYAALFLGDPTARFAKRLTLNPLRHLDPVGSVIVPLILATVDPKFIFGWAKPVPINPYNLRGRYGEAIVAFAGPLSNLLIAIAFGLMLRFLAPLEMLSDGAIALTVTLVSTNIYLALFNLVPLPPLDGSRLLLVFLPRQADRIRAFLDRYGLVLVLFFAFFFAQLLIPIATFLFRLIMGS